MGSGEKGNAKMLEVIIVHCVQLDVVLWKTDTAITITITQNCLKWRKSDISSKDRISDELIKLLQLRQKPVIGHSHICQSMLEMDLS